MEKVGGICIFVRGSITTITALYHHTDESLLAMLTDENRAQVFTVFYERYALSMLNVAIKKLHPGHESSADDLVHDIFIGFHEKLPSLPAGTNVHGYLYASLKNRILNFLRKESYKVQHVNASDGCVFVEPQTHPFSFERLEREIYDHIKLLPEQCRKVFVLNRFENYTNKQIAETLGISINTVEQHMRKALRLLRERMDYKVFLLLWLEGF